MKLLAVGASRERKLGSEEGWSQRAEGPDENKVQAP